VPRDAAAQHAHICFRPPTLEPAGAFSASARGLILSLLAKQSFLRPTAEEARSHAFLKRDEATVDAAAEAEAARLTLTVLRDPQHEHRLSTHAGASGTPAGTDEGGLVSGLDALALSAKAARGVDAGAAERTQFGTPSTREASQRDECSTSGSLVSWASSLVHGSP
jgi:hypothetical protein